MLVVRGLLGGLFQLALFASLLLIPAGTVNWPRAIQFLLAYGVVLFASIIWLGTVAPSSLEARLEPAINKKQPIADRVATAFIGVAVGGWMIFIPIDVFRLQLLPAPSLGVSISAEPPSCATGFAITLTALYQNAFATPVVRDQSERGHTLVDTGLYAHVRHPFYTGFLRHVARARPVARKLCRRHRAAGGTGKPPGAHPHRGTRPYAKRSPATPST